MSSVQNIGMKIEKDKVVSMVYTLKNDKGEVIDSNDAKNALGFLQGHGNIIPGLEEALEGKAQGDKLNVSIPPEKAYGERQESMVQQLERKQFGDDEPKVGMQFQADGQHGPFIVTVTNMEGDTVTVDANHPLAGEQLHFDVEITEVRNAEEEELAHGHVHGPGGHQH